MVKFIITIELLGRDDEGEAIAEIQKFLHGIEDNIRRLKPFHIGAYTMNEPPFTYIRDDRRYEKYD